MAKIDEEMAGKSADYDADFERGIAHHLHEVGGILKKIIVKSSDWLAVLLLAAKGAQLWSRAGAQPGDGDGRGFGGE